MTVFFGIALNYFERCHFMFKRLKFFNFFNLGQSGEVGDSVMTVLIDELN